MSVLAFNAGVSAGVVPASTSSVAGLAPPFHPPDDLIARRLIRQVRRAINEYRDDRRLALVRARNQLLKTIILTALVTYLLVALAVLSGVPRPAFTSAIACFLIGATVGLFNRLYLDASTETAVEDYGLSAARLLHTPLLCGLAAVFGLTPSALISRLQSEAEKYKSDLKSSEEPSAH